MTRPKAAAPVRDEVKEFVRSSEEALAAARDRWAASLRDVVPSDGHRMRKIVDEAFDFAEELLSSQRQFAHSVLDALVGQEAPKRAPKPTAKRVPRTRPAAKGGAKPAKSKAA